MPSLLADPLKIASLNLVRGADSPINIQLSFKNAEFRGLSQSMQKTLKGFDENLNSQVFELATIVPRGELVGQYKMSGTALVLPIRGEGKANIVFEQTEMGVKMMVKPVMKGGQVYLQVDKVKMNILPKR